MAVMSGDYLKTNALKCEQCKGKYFNKNQAKRQELVRAELGTPLPNACVDSEIDGCKCPYQH